jgi:3'(2'), 5'-bisphosphate nucleotidase
MYRTTTKLESINIQGLLDTARKAGEAIMEIYNTPFEVIKKADGSPLTLADQAANTIINDYLLANYSIPILSEENEDIPYEIRKDWKQLWIVDPLDGTKEFVHKRREFTVNIALVQDNKPVIGVIYAPVFDEMYYAIKGQGAFFIYKNKTVKLDTKPSLIFENQTFHSPTKKHIKVILSRSHNDGFDLGDYLRDESLYSLQTIAMGSSLKFCRIAQGNVDLNIRMLPTSEWDTAAAQIIVEEAGRNLVKYKDGTPLDYNKKDILNPSFVCY